MFVKWDPEDGSEVQTWTFDPGDVGRKEGMLIEKHYGGSWDQFLAGLQMGQLAARAALLWYMMTLVHPKVKFEDIPNFRVRQLTVDMGVNELKDLWDRAKRIRLSPDQREAFEAQFEQDMRDALKREGREEDGFTIDGDKLAIEGSVVLPKAPSPSNGGSTGSTSPTTSTSTRVPKTP